MSRNFAHAFGIIALVSVIGFGFLACGEKDDPADPNDPNNTDDPGDTVVTPGSGKYSGKDVLGNAYSLSVGSDANRSVYTSESRAAKSGDLYSMDIKTRDGTTRTVKAGTIKSIDKDGTLTLQPDGGAGTFTATVRGGTLNAVAGSGGEIAQIPLADNTTITPRTFNEIHLRAARQQGSGESGEYWSSGKSVLVKDFPTNVSKLEKNTSGRYTITVSGTSNVAMKNFSIEVQGLAYDDQWKYLGGSTNDSLDLLSISAGTFNKTIEINTSNESYSYDLMGYKEVVLQVTNVDNGTITGDIPDGRIMATITDFKIVLKDTARDPFKGNMDDYAYGFKEDGLSVDYRQAVWRLTAANITDAKNPRAMFEFIMEGMADIKEFSPVLYFVWQDPVKGDWQQDKTTICGRETGGEFGYIGGVTWDARAKRMTIDLSKVIKGGGFNGATELNFIIGYLGGNGSNAGNIGDLVISGANIFVAPSPTQGNMGSYQYGYQEDGVSIEYKQAVWNLPAAALLIATQPGAKLEIAFSQDVITSKKPRLYLVWQDIPTQRWWPDESTDYALCYNEDNTYKYHEGVTYDQGAKKLTVVLETGLETYDDFINATDVNFVLDCTYGVNSINDLGIASVNIMAPE